MNDAASKWKSNKHKHCPKIAWHMQVRQYGRGSPEEETHELRKKIAAESHFESACNKSSKASGLHVKQAPRNHASVVLPGRAQ